MAGQRALLVQGFELQARFGQAAFALAQFQPGVETSVNAVLHQLEHFSALGQRAARHRCLLVQAHQLEISPRHLASKQQAGGLRIGFGGFDAAQRSIERGAVFAEEIELPTRAQLCRGAVADGARQRRRDGAVGGVTLVRQVDLAVELRLAGGARAFASRLGASESGLGQFEAGAVLQGLVNQAVERRVAEIAPPLGADGCA